MPDDIPLTEDQKKILVKFIERHKATVKAHEEMQAEVEAWCKAQIEAAGITDPDNYFVCTDHGHIVRKRSLEEVLEEALGVQLQFQPLDEDPTKGTVH